MCSNSVDLEELSVLSDVMVLDHILEPLGDDCFFCLFV